MKNRFAPISRVPPEVLSLIPDFWGVHEGDEVDEDDEDLITLTHVCRAWRVIFISRSSLWKNFHCVSADKTRVYLERSKSSPINVWLDMFDVLPSYDPLFRIIPHSVGRLKSLSITAMPEAIPKIIAHLPPHAPLLERLEIDCTYRPWMRRDPALTTALFSGDLSSLRLLRLEGIRTELPWRNMVNLTTFALCHMQQDTPTIPQLLDFFESAPRLCEIDLDAATPVTGGQIGRLVSLACLKRMEFARGSPSSRLLSHLLVPVGAKLTVQGDSFESTIKDHLPRSLDNLRNISNFTEIYLYIDRSIRVELSGPSGKFCMTSCRSSDNLRLEHLARLDTSQIERLEVVGNNYPLTHGSYRGLLPLKTLRILTLSRFRSPYTLMAALRPNTGPLACPKLEEFVLVLRTATEAIDFKSLTEIAAARALRGARLRTVRIVGGRDEPNLGSMAELGKHVLNVEHEPLVDAVDSDSDESSDSDDSDDSDGDFW